VEYDFPTSTPSHTEEKDINVATELTRIASKNIQDGSELFLSPLSLISKSFTCTSVLSFTRLTHLAKNIPKRLFCSLTCKNSGADMACVQLSMELRWCISQEWSENKADNEASLRSTCIVWQCNKIRCSIIICLQIFS